MIGAAAVRAGKGSALGIDTLSPGSSPSARPDPPPMASPLSTMKRWFRGLVGTDALLRRHRDLEARVGRDAVLLGNALAYDRAHPDDVRGLPEYRRVAEVADLLRTFRVEGTGFVRLGGENDGGYVMLDSLEPPAVTVAYSFGVGHDVSWDAAVAARGVDVLLYDHTVRSLPAPVPRARFVRQGIRGAEPLAGCRTLAEILSDNGHSDRTDLVLKLDIEGAEWPVIAEAPERTLGQFAQIAIEFHGMSRAATPRGHAAIVAALSKLAATHVPVHVHGNSYHTPLWIGDLVLPDVLEVTWARSRDHEGRFVPRDEPFPTDLDRPTLPDRPDLFLGRTFTAPRGSGTGRRPAGPGSVA